MKPFVSKMYALSVRSGRNGLVTARLTAAWGCSDENLLRVVEYHNHCDAP